jgi:hypothetical protein
MQDDSLEHERNFRGLRNVRPLASAGIQVSFTPRERRVLVDQALQVLSEVYVHLPLKRAIRAIDPERRLRLLQLRLGDDLDGAKASPEPSSEDFQGLAGLGLDELLAPASAPDAGLAGLGLDELLSPDPPRDDAAEPWETMSDREFEDELMDVFASLHDLHTQYIAPDPARRSMAFLPLLVEECWEYDDRGRQVRSYLVSKVYGENEAQQDGLEGARKTAGKGFRAGVRVTHWNGIPIDLAVLRRAERSPGANAHAQHVRGLESLTCRWLGTAPRPDEEFVRVTYLDGKESRDVKLSWYVGELPRPDKPAEEQDANAGRAARIGLDPQTEMRRRLKYELYAAADLRSGSSTTKTGPRDAPRFDRIQTPEGDVGYLRIHTFAVSDVDAFIEDIKHGLKDLPERGLVIDVRGNPGGDILAGERLLALLAPEHKADPQLLHFRITPTARRIAERLGAQGGPWAETVLESIRSGLKSGAPYSSGSAIDALPEVTEPGYPGPLVLVVDALCYSTAEVFAAGFQDNRLGRILGTERGTGGGAGNSWEYAALAQFGGNEQFPSLPTGTAVEAPARARAASFVVAVRRLTRAGALRGETFEEFGVLSDVRPYRMTHHDLLNKNAGLKQAAARLLTAT